MKDTSARLIIVETALGAVALTMVTPPPLQTLSMIVSGIVPFDFYVGNKKLPAGTYVVSSIINDGAAQVLDKALTIPDANCNSDSTGELVFNVYGEEHFLSEVQWSGYTVSAVPSLNVDPLASSLWPEMEMKAPSLFAGRLLFISFNRLRQPNKSASGTDFQLQHELPLVRPYSAHYFGGPANCASASTTIAVRTPDQEEWRRLQS
jgi:hypothetical protein